VTSRRTTLLAPILAAAVLFPRASIAQDCAVQGEVTGWTIRSFVSDYNIHENGEIEVVERIEVDFDRHQRHGIFRVIPVKYRRLVREDVPIAAGTVSYDLDVRQIVDGAGQPYRFEVSNDGANKRIRIGSPDFCVTGLVTYVLHYRLSGGLGFFDEFDELYWQVTGTAWPVPIEDAEAVVRLPSERALAYADSAPWQAHCYAGWADSTSDEDCTVEMPSPGYYRFAATRTLEAGQGLTLAAGFPKGVIPGPTPAERALDTLFRYGPLAIPFLAFGILLAVWRRYGKEPAMGSIAPQWRAPDGLRPGPAGALVDQRADMDDVIATVLDLAVRGWIQIREVPPKLFDADSLPGKILGALGLDSRDWELVRLGKDVAELEPFELKVLEGILDGKDSRRLSDLKHEFYKELSGIKKEIYDDLVKRKLFPRSPQTTRTIWLVMGLLLTIGGVALGMIGVAAGFWALMPAFVLSGIQVITFGMHMPKMTPAGAVFRRHLEGLEEYIRRAEKAEMEFKDAPAKTPELFSELLPYAVALDVSDLWVDQFRGILTQPPGWYAGTWTGSGPGGGWNMAGFSEALGDFHSAASSTLQSAPGGSSGSGSGGGGSVGGGGGGGGGGSW
jgi:uncharacterized membrane protein YgcG